MKWNYEWVDLQTIDQMISDCWRMNSQQLKEFQQQLWQQQDLIFAGDMGTAFIELAGKVATWLYANNYKSSDSVLL